MDNNTKQHVSHITHIHVCFSALSFPKAKMLNPSLRWLCYVELLTFKYRPNRITRVPTKSVRKNSNSTYAYTGELGYDGLNGTRKIGPSYAKSVLYI